MAISFSFAIDDVFAQAPGDEIIISGNYTNEEFGFSVALPDSLDGFLTEFDIPSVGKIVKFQIRPEMEGEICCPPIDSSPIQIEKFNDMLYYVSESLDLNPDSGKIIFKDVLFAPHILDPPRQTYSFVTFADEKKKALSVGFDEPAFSENVDPQAGFVKRTNGYHLLVSANLEKISPLKQFKSGIATDEIQCKENLALIQKHDGSPACVTSDTKTKLIEREWTESITPVLAVHFDYPEFLVIDSLHPDDVLEIRHRESGSILEVYLSSWNDYKEWENRRGPQSTPLPPLIITEENMHPALFEMLKEMWVFEGYEVSEHDKNVFRKDIKKDPGDPINREVYSWLKEERNKVFGDDSGFSSYFEFRDKVYQIGLMVID